MTTRTNHKTTGLARLTCPVWGLVLSLSGCVNPDRIGSDRAGNANSSTQIIDFAGVRLVSRGDWDDVDAAVDVGLGAIEAASLGIDHSMPGLIVYEFVTIRDDPGRLEIRQLDLPPDEPGIEILASIGHFARPKEEQRLVRAIARRLRQLHGVQTSPVR